MASEYPAIRAQARRERATIFWADATGLRSDPDWKGEIGYITRDMILRHVGNVMGPVYYIAGPPAMVSAMEKILRDAGVKREDMRSEMFSGY